MKGIKIHFLVDNQTTGPLKCEHGLSMLIETEEATILCDMGASDIFLHNAQQMGIDLEKIDFAFISHGHSDHTGGLRPLLKSFPDKIIYASRTIFNEYYFSGRRGYWRAMSTDHSLFKEYPNNFSLIEEPTEEGQPQGKWITPSIAIVSNSCHKWSRPYGNIYLTKQPAANGLNHLTADPAHLLPDSFLHELSLALLTPKGLVIISSCSHCGAINIMESCLKFTGQQKIHAFIGGLHFIDSPQVGEEVETFAEEVKTFATELHKTFDTSNNGSSTTNAPSLPKIITGHCTSNPAKELLSKKISGIEFFYTGAIIEL